MRKISVNDVWLRMLAYLLEAGITTKMGALSERCQRQNER